MSTCTVNGLEYEAHTGLETWGQLLDALERGDGPERPIVTAVRFGGVDEPSFRESAALVRRLGMEVPVDVDICGAGELITSAVEVALDGLDPLTATARQTADAFRRHELPAAHRGLADFVSTLQMLATLTVAVSRIDPSRGDAASEKQSAEFLERLSGSLESLVAFNVNEDWLSVADVLEYEMAELIPAWRFALHAAGRGASSRPMAEAAAWPPATAGCVS